MKKFFLFILISFLMHIYAFASSGNSFIFWKNKGQIYDSENKLRKDVLFTAKTNKFNLYFTKNTIIFTYLENQDSIYNLIRFDIIFENSNFNPKIIPYQKVGNKINIYSHSNPKGLTGINGFNKLTYRNIYNNIDLTFYFKDGELCYDIIKKQNSNINDVKIQFDGLSDNSKPQISTNYQKTKKSKIETILGFPTFVGGNSWDYTRRVQIDSYNNVYVCGNTTSSNFPTTPGAYKRTNAGQKDTYVMKFDYSGNLIWSTLIGSPSDDNPFGLSISKDQSIWVAGESFGPGFPVTPDGWQKNYGGDVADAYLIKFDPTGNLIYSTYLGGGSYDVFADMVLDNNDNVWLTGRTTSSNFPTTSNAFQTIFQGNYDGFLVKFDKAGKLKYSSCYGGSIDEYAEGIAFDSKHNLIAISGYTGSNDLPMRGYSFQSKLNSSFDAFLACFDTTGNIKWSTYFGGSNDDFGSNLASDLEGNFIIGGYTFSTNLPNLNAYQKNIAGGLDAFFAKFTYDGHLDWATYYGGSKDESANGGHTIMDQGGGIKTDSYGNIIFCGRQTNSTNLPLSSPTFQDHLAGSSDSYVIEMDKQGQLIWSTYLGGSKDDFGMDACFDLSDSIIVVGGTSSPDFPVSSNAYQKNYAGEWDGYIFKLLSCSNLDLHPEIASASLVNLCDGDSMFLNTKAKYAHYRWSTGDSTEYIVVKKDGKYSVTVWNTKCDTSYSNIVEVKVNPKPMPNITVSGFSSICQGDSVKLEANSGYSSYEWYDEAGNKIGSGSSLVVRQSGKYYVKVKSADGCEGVSEMKEVTFGGGADALVITGEFCNGEIKWDSTWYPELVCKKFNIKNVSSQPVTLEDSYLSFNIAFSVPQSQFPMIITPGESRELMVCFSPTEMSEQIDTIMIKDLCSIHKVPLRGLGPAGPFEGDSKCNVIIRGKVKKLPQNYEPMFPVPYPNPAGDFINIKASGFNEELTVEIYNIHGEKLKMYIPKSEFGNEGYSNRGEIKINVSSLTSGLYFLKIKIDGYSKFWGIVKE